MGLLAEYIILSQTEIDQVCCKGNAFSHEEAIGSDSAESAHSYKMQRFWDGMHFLLTGTPSCAADGSNQLSNAVIGVHVLPSAKSFVSWVTPNEVPSILTALNKVDIDQLVAGMDLKKFREAFTYPDIWHDRSIKRLRTELRSNFYSLKWVYTQACDEHRGILISIN